MTVNVDVGILLTITGTVVVVLEHPFSVTDKVTFSLPDPAQLTVYGPCPAPVTTVPPEKPQAYVAAPVALPVYVIVEFWPVHTGVVTVNVDVGMGLTVIAKSVSDEHPFSVTDTPTSAGPGDANVTLNGPCPLWVGGVPP